MAEPALLVLHALAPPTPGGTPVVLHRLLAGLDGVRLETVTDARLRRRVAEGDGLLLPGLYRFVWKWPGWGSRWRLGRVARVALNCALAVVAGMRAARWARTAGAAWVLSVSDEGFSPLAGYVAAQIARLPHLILVFDLWEENAYPEADRRLAHMIEGPLWRSAAGVVVFCREMADHYRAKHGIECAVIPTPIEVGSPPAPERVAFGGERREVLLAGAVYWAQEAAVRRFLRAAARVAEASVTLLGDERELRARGFEAARYEPPRQAGVFRRRLAEADVLFLGLSFNSLHPAVIRTATPARLAEYMASGTPLLVHAPEGSYAAEYARREDFAEVVDCADEAALAAGLRAVLADREQAARRARRARELARERHDATAVRARFRSILTSVHRRLRV